MVCTLHVPSPLLKQNWMPSASHLSSFWLLLYSVHNISFHDGSLVFSIFLTNTSWGVWKLNMHAGIIDASIIFPCSLGFGCGWSYIVCISCGSLNVVCSWGMNWILLLWCVLIETFLVSCPYLISWPKFLKPMCEKLKFGRMGSLVGCLLIGIKRRARIFFKCFFPLGFCGYDGW